ncbi:MAG TPA: hypothetical protein VF221_20235 [Chloroflexota bacterium]
MTLIDDRPGTVPIASSLTTAPTWSSPSELREYEHPRFSTRQAARPALKVYAEGAHLPQWFDGYLNSELNRLFALPARWDGLSADEVTVEAVSGVLAILASIVDEATQAPQFFPLLDGGIQAEWHVGGNDVEIEIDGAGSAYVAATRSTGETVIDAEIRASGDERTISQVATFLNELSQRFGLAHLSCDVRCPRGSAVLRRRRP